MVVEARWGPGCTLPGAELLSGGEGQLRWQCLCWQGPWGPQGEPRTFTLAVGSGPGARGAEGAAKCLWFSADLVWG